MEKAKRLKEIDQKQMQGSLRDLLGELGDLREDFSLASLTTFRIGGRAEYFFIPFSEEHLGPPGPRMRRDCVRHTEITELQG